MRVLSEKVRAKITDAVIAEYAKFRADGYYRYDSFTTEHHKILSGIISGALQNIRYGRDIQATADAAEFIAMHLLDGLEIGGEKINFADAVYWPIKCWALDMGDLDA